MAMGKRKRDRQPTMWVATQDLPRSAAHPFYLRLNQILEQHDFDGFVEGLCERVSFSGWYCPRRRLITRRFRARGA
jgi:hypothetical protein